MTSHTFKPMQYDQHHCRICKMLVGHPSHTMALAGMETADADREAARQLAQAEELTAAMRQPRASISAKAGRMERESPLFFGTGANPLLF